MNATISNVLTSDDIGSALNVDASPVALQLSPGSAIFTVRGEVWITQERMHEDVVLGAGGRFDVATREVLVISATKGTAELHIARPAAARAHRMANVYDFARGYAKALSQREAGHVTSALAAALRGLWLRLRAMTTLTSRAAHH